MRERPLFGKIVCPWWLCYTFDNPLRRLLHDPHTLLGRYVRPGDRVIDLGPGMGYFTIPMAELVGPAGHVTAIDIQPKMLSVIVKRARESGVSDRITPHLADRQSIGKHEKADFILAFWMLHEVPDPRGFLAEIRNLLKPAGLFLLVEPRIHVPEKSFSLTLQTARELGLVIKGNPDIRISRTALLALGNEALKPIHQSQPCI